MKLRRSALAAAVFPAGLLAIATLAGPSRAGDDAAALSAATALDRQLDAENAGKPLQPAEGISDLAFLRRTSVDLIGRIPSEAELRDYLKWPAAERRTRLVDRLVEDPRFVDRWTVFLADMLRIRSESPGGDTLAAFVHQAISDRMPYDEMCRQLITANGKAGKVPQVGFILGDNADPLAMAGVTAQVFLGIRVSCAQCHDHPFDVWTREQFYGLAAYYGRTRRVESRLTKAVFTTETQASAVLWPPEDAGDSAPRKPVQPSFPFQLASAESPAIERLAKLRASQAAQAQAAANRSSGASVEDLLEAGARKAGRLTPAGTQLSSVSDESQQAARALDVQRDLYRESELRGELAAKVTSPANRYFSRSLVNRLWAELVGRGFVEPVDDFNAENPASHPKSLDLLADEFVASGFDLRTPIRIIVGTRAYARGHASGTSPADRSAAEQAFVAAPVRRMLSEALFDSVVQAGHLFEAKHPAGENMKEITTIVREQVARKPGAPSLKASQPPEGAPAMAMSQPLATGSGGYDLESAIEVNFDTVLARAKDAPAVEAMEKMSSAELEQDQDGARMKYVERQVTSTVDDNPKFASAMRMAAPAPPAHFLRIFGQTSRDALGEFREHNPSMRQALMMLNGRLTHEASRVGKLEPMYRLLSGKSPDVGKAVRFAYREILTREPSADELAEGRTVVATADSALDGIADLRWALFNCHEFRYLP